MNEQFNTRLQKQIRQQVKDQINDQLWHRLFTMMDNYLGSQVTTDTQGQVHSHVENVVLQNIHQITSHVNAELFQQGKHRRLS